MPYEIPGFLKDELLFGELSDKIDAAINSFENIFKEYPMFANESLEDIKSAFIGYICYTYLLIDDEMTQYVFLKTLKSSEPTMRLYPLMEEYIATCLLSNKSDESIKNDLDEFQKEYLRTLGNIISKDFQILSEKNDEEYKKIIEQNYVDYDTDIDPGLLLILTKCVIIENKKSNEVYFKDVDEAILYALELYYKQTITFEERKAAVLNQQQVLDVIKNILKCNEFIK